MLAVSAIIRPAYAWALDPSNWNLALTYRNVLAVIGTWIGTSREEQFLMEAGYSLPGIAGDSRSLHAIFDAALHQRARLKQDQQLRE